MKKLAFLFFIVPTFSFAQQSKPGESIPELRPDSGAIRVLLPEISEFDWYQIEAAGILAPRKDVVSADSVYYKIFSRYPKAALPSFDFTKQELNVKFFCMQCLTTCPRVNGQVAPCHRNACSYRAFWYVRNKPE